MKISRADINVLVLIILTFVVTRVILTVVGLASMGYWEKKLPSWYEWNYSSHKILDIWSVWDSGWYLDIALNGYSPTLTSDLPKRVCCGQNNLPFFPLYPVAMRLLSSLIKDSYLAGILISNIAFVLAAFFLYKLVRLDDDEKLGRRAIKYLFLFPTSYIFSALFSESLFLFLAIAVFYFAKLRKWKLVGIFGFFLALTKSLGIMVFIPLAYEYFASKRFSLKRIDKNVLFLLLIPAGTLVYLGYVTYLTGNIFSYFRAESEGWNHTLVNPFIYIRNALNSTSIVASTIAKYIVLEALLLFTLIKKVSPTLRIYSLLFFCLPLFSGGETNLAMLRFASIVFPMYIILAKVTSNLKIDLMLCGFLFISQVLFMFFWSYGLFGY